MAEQIIFSIAQEILKNLASQALQEFGTVLGVKEELKKLGITISTVKDVLLDAEEKQKHSRSVAGWLARLKHVAYDADDLLDQVATKALLRVAETHTITRPFRDFNFSYNIAPKVKEIREKLELIAKDRQQFEFVVVNEEKRVSSSRREEISFMDRFHAPLRMAEKLRTFILRPKCRPVLGSFVEVLISSFSYLRVLDLSYSNLKELPDSVGKLKLLRYIDLTANGPVEKLPNSVCKLLNLQTLCLHLCRQLQELPADFGKLTRLRHFSISPKFGCLPEKLIQSLTSLQTLTVSRSETLTSLSEGVQCLTSLTKLVIILCSKLESLPKGIENLHSLKTLFIGSCQELKFTNTDLKGLSSLKALTLSRLPNLEALPGGLEDAANSLTYLFIEDCKKMETLPEWLKKFKSLRKLVIRNCPNLQSLPASVQYLTTLRHLEITRCPHLSQRCKMEIGEDWDHIKHVHEIYIDGKKAP
ncbi:Leucine-rich repeat [Dillenia turbinata]|uniref:Leucine-rich repeat n=1 Tax=Dillenia turbinata TaxID=194707 RepID=A0AAN8ZTZ3_9MAGN